MPATSTNCLSDNNSYRQVPETVRMPIFHSDPLADRTTAVQAFRVYDSVM